MRGKAAMLCCTKDVTWLSACCAARPRSVIFLANWLMTSSRNGTTVRETRVRTTLSFHITPNIKSRESTAVNEVTSPC